MEVVVPVGISIQGAIPKSLGQHLENLCIEKKIHLSVTKRPQCVDQHIYYTEKLWHPKFLGWSQCEWRSTLAKELEVVVLYIIKEGEGERGASSPSSIKTLWKNGFLPTSSDFCSIC